MAFGRIPGEDTEDTGKEEGKSGKQPFETENKKFLVVKFKSDIIAFEL